MAIYIRRVGEVADGAVTEVKIANNAVTENKINNGAVTSVKLEDGAVIEQKLANLAVTTGKLQDQSVTLAKAQQALKIHHFTGDETEVNVADTTETEVKVFKITKSSSQTSGMQPQKIHINAQMKTSDSGTTATMKLYINAEGSPRITLNSTSLTWEMVEGVADFSDLANGAHDITLKLVSDSSGATAYNDLVEIFIEK